MPFLRKQGPILWKLDGVGDIILKRRKGSKGVSIVIKPSNQVVVTFPMGYPLSQVKWLVENRRNWIAKTQEKNRAKEPVQPIGSGFKTREHELQLIPSMVQTTKVKIEGKKLAVTHPFHLNTDDTQFQEVLKGIIAETYRMEAQTLLPQRVELLAKQHNLTYNTVRIKNITSRWGSCSIKGNINLSIYLMKLPNHLIDYVILHELAHRVHMNHSNEFWSFLDGLVSSNAKLLSKELKGYTCRI